MSDNLFKKLRKLQYLIPYLYAFYGVLDSVFGWGYAKPVGTIVSALIGLLGNILQLSSDKFFQTHEIIDGDEVLG